MNSFLLFIGGASFGAVVTAFALANWALEKSNEPPKEEPDAPAQ